MRERIWGELSEALFNMYYLNYYINRQRRIGTIIQVVAIVFSFGSIAGWYKFSEYSKMWAFILVLLQLLHFFRGRLMTDDVELAKLNNLQFFYTESKSDLERLFNAISTDRITDTQAEKKFAVLQQKEIEVMKMLDHKQVKDIKSLNSLSIKNRDSYLSKIN